MLCPSPGLQGADPPPNSIGFLFVPGERIRFHHECNLLQASLSPPPLLLTAASASTADAMPINMCCNLLMLCLPSIIPAGIDQSLYCVWEREGGSFSKGLGTATTVTLLFFSSWTPVLYLQLSYGHPLGRHVSLVSAPTYGHHIYGGACFQLSRRSLCVHSSTSTPFTIDVFGSVTSSASESHSSIDVALPASLQR